MSDCGIHTQKKNNLMKKKTVKREETSRYISKYITAMLLSLLLSSFGGKAVAQRCLPGQKAIQVSASFVDGFNLSNGNKQAFAGGAFFSRYLRNGNRTEFGIEYLQKKHAYKDMLIPVSQITAEGGYRLVFLSDASKTLFLSLGASLMAGYETVNWDKKVLFDGATITSEDNFLYGGAVSINADIFLSDRFAITLHVKERLLLGSSVNEFHTQAGAGLKVIIN